MKLSDVLYQLPHLYERIERGRAELAAAEAALEQLLSGLPTEQAIALRVALLYYVPPVEQAVGMPVEPAVAVAPSAALPAEQPPELPATWDEAPVETPDQLEAPAAELVQADAPEIPAEAVAVDQPPDAPAEEVQEDGRPIAAPDPVWAAAEPEADPEGWVSCKAYAVTCGVSEPVIYNAIAKGVIHGPAVQVGPPKRVRPELADRQILQKIEPSLLRANVAKRVERSTVLEELPPEERPLTAPEAARFLRGKGYLVIEQGEDAFQVDGVATTKARLIQRATEIRARDARLAQARRSAA